MAKLSYRNSRGNLVEIATFAATRAKNEFGAILEKTAQGAAVAITRHEKPKAVILSYDEFESLVKARSPSLDDLGAECDDLLARMQTPKAKKAMKAAFEAAPSQLGLAAAKRALKSR